MKQLIPLLTFILLATINATRAQDAANPADASATGTSKPTMIGDNNSKDASNPAESQYEIEKVRRRSVPFAVTIGAYYPTSKKVRDIFGSKWTRYGLRPLPMAEPRIWRPTFDICYYRMSRTINSAENSVTLIPVTVGLIRGFGTPENVRGYAAANAGLYFCNLDAPTAGVSKDGIGLTTNVSLGLLLGKRFSAEGRYEFMNKFAGFDFSAFTLSAAFTVFTAKF
ncbi:MAG: hypothetical protein K6T99_03755 [Armatimonadetes bacterium]|nr:hypothetical protein [Armatimonadota bacterium]